MKFHSDALGNKPSMQGWLCLQVNPSLGPVCFEGSPGFQALLAVQVRLLHEPQKLQHFSWEALTYMLPSLSLKGAKSSAFCCSAPWAIAHSPWEGNFPQAEGEVAAWARGQDRSGQASSRRGTSSVARQAERTTRRRKAAS